MDFSILGAIQVSSDGVSLPVGGSREASVLALILLGEGRPTPAERLIDAMWDKPPPSARAQLHNLVSRLRARPYGHLILTHPIGYTLRLGVHRLDVVEFRRLVKQGCALIADGDHGGAVAALSRASALWRGPALAGVPGEFADAARMALEEERLLAADELFHARLATGDHADVLRELPELIAEHPYRESLHEVHMTALAAAGRQAEALEAYRAIYRRLREELGVEPGKALRETEQRILRGELSSTVRRSEVTRLVPRELPPSPATLTGREKLVVAISAELRGDEVVSPVAVLAGPGGIGKSALAITVAHAVAGTFPGGQLFADMRGSHDDPASVHAVAGRFLRGMGVEGSRLPHDAEERLALYRSMLAQRRVLVVLDDAHSEEQVRGLLPGGSGCATLVTSRRLLGGLIGAARFPVPVLARVDALELLARIVGRERVEAEPAAALDIVDNCGHLPLATCIAATRLAVRPDWTLADFKLRLASQRRRLDELAVGDLDVRASIGLSYEALQPRLRALFRRLGLVSAPDWPMWVAEVLGGEQVDKQLDQLIDVHLVEPIGRDSVGQERFRLHDLVAEFARETAFAEDDEAARASAENAVAAAWLGLAAYADELLGHGLSYGDGVEAPSPPPSAALRIACETPRAWFEAERASLVAAARSACRLGRADLATGLALRLYGYFALSAHRDDQERTLRDALALALRDRLRMRLVSMLFAVCVMRDQNAELPALAAEFLNLARRLRDRRHEILALKQCGLAARRLGRLGEAARWSEQAIASCDDDTPKDVVVLALASASILYREAGQPRRALPFAERMLEIQRSLGPPRQTGNRLTTYAVVLIDLGRFDEAEQVIREAMQNLEGAEDVSNLAYAEQLLACVDMGRGVWDKAAAGLLRSREVFTRLRDRLSVIDLLRLEGDLAILRGRPADAVAQLEQAAALCRQLDAPLELARILARLALVLNKLDEPAATRYRQEYQAFLAEAELDERCLRMPC